MIPFHFNLPDIFKFPQNIRQDIWQSYALRRDHAFGNRDYRNTLLAAPLEQSLANLRQIEGRIESRIAKEEASGKDMTATNIMLAAAKESLLNAASAVAEATSTINGTGLHPAYVNAHFALNDARDALGAVVNSISIDMASSTPE